MLRKPMLIVALLCAAPQAYAEYSTISKRQIGDWEVEEAEDGLTSKRRWLAVSGGEAAGGLLVVKCDPGRSGVYVQVIFPQYMGGDYDEREFTYRVDSAPPVETRWQYQDNSALMFNNHPAWDFIQDIRDGKVLRLRGLTYEFEAVDAKVPIGGGRAALKAVYSGCNDPQWTD